MSKVVGAEFSSARYRHAAEICRIRLEELLNGGTSETPVKSTVAIMGRLFELAHFALEGDGFPQIKGVRELENWERDHIYGANRFVIRTYNDIAGEARRTKNIADMGRAIRELHYLNESLPILMAVPEALREDYGTLLKFYESVRQSGDAAYQRELDEDDDD